MSNFIKRLEDACGMVIAIVLIWLIVTPCALLVEIYQAICNCIGAAVDTTAVTAKEFFA